MEEKDTPNSVATEVLDIAKSLSIELDETQLNIGGEREFLSPDKQVLIGTKTDTNERVAMKCSNQPAGAEEIETEHNVRLSLQGLPFAERELIMPKEIFYGVINGYTVSVSGFIPQEKVFTDYSLHEQFFMALHALECQESFHATTHEHQSSIRDQFALHSPEFYLQSTTEMNERIKAIWPASGDTLNRAEQLLKDHQPLLKGYHGYLIHEDFVPHNFRIHNRQLYLLDFVSFRLGNKYESWARFINFMDLHSPELVPLLMDYVKNDRGEEEYQVLRLMRAYKSIFLLDYYAKTYQKTEGNLKELTKARLIFWTAILDSILRDQPLNQNIREHYYRERARLRTEKEKDRQRQFTWA